MKLPLPVRSGSVASSVVLWVGIAALAGLTRAQDCSQQFIIPNECCPPFPIHCQGIPGGGEGDGVDLPFFAVLPSAVSSYGSVKGSVPLDMEGTGLMGIAAIYPSSVVVDLSRPA
jgi:hypothetical protein